MVYCLSGALLNHLRCYWSSREMSPTQVSLYSFHLAVSVTVIFTSTFFDFLHVCVGICVTVSMLNYPVSARPNHWRQKAIYWVSWARDQRFHLDSPGQPVSWIVCFLYVVNGCVLRNRRISGKLSSINGSTERDSKSLNREGHQKHRMNFLADLLKADKVCECVTASSVSVHLRGVHVYAVRIKVSCVLSGNNAMKKWLYSYEISWLCVNGSVLLLQCNSPFT